MIDFSDPTIPAAELDRASFGATRDQLKLIARNPNCSTNLLVQLFPLCPDEVWENSSTALALMVDPKIALRFAQRVVRNASLSQNVGLNLLTYVDDTNKDASVSRVIDSLTFSIDYKDVENLKSWLSNSSCEPDTNLAVIRWASETISLDDLLSFIEQNLRKMTPANAITRIAELVSIGLLSSEWCDDYLVRAFGSVDKALEHVNRHPEYDFIVSMLLT